MTLEAHLWEPCVTRRDAEGTPLEGARGAILEVLRGVVRDVSLATADAWRLLNLAALARTAPPDPHALPVGDLRLYRAALNAATETVDPGGRRAVGPTATDEAAFPFLAEARARFDERLGAARERPSRLGISNVLDHAAGTMRANAVHHVRAQCGVRLADRLRARPELRALVAAYGRATPTARRAVAAAVSAVARGEEAVRAYAAPVAPVAPGGARAPVAVAAEVQEAARRVMLEEAARIARALEAAFEDAAAGPRRDATGSKRRGGARAGAPPRCLEEVTREDSDHDPGVALPLLRAWMKEAAGDDAAARAATRRRRGGRAGFTLLPCPSTAGPLHVRIDGPAADEIFGRPRPTHRTAELWGRLPDVARAMADRAAALEANRVARRAAEERKAGIPAEPEAPTVLQMLFPALGAASSVTTNGYEMAVWREFAGAGSAREVAPEGAAANPAARLPALPERGFVRASRVPVLTEAELDAYRVVGVDGGIAYPVYCAFADDLHRGGPRPRRYARRTFDLLTRRRRDVPRTWSFRGGRAVRTRHPARAPRPARPPRGIKKVLRRPGAHHTFGISAASWRIKSGAAAYDRALREAKAESRDPAARALRAGRARRWRRDAPPADRPAFDVRVAESSIPSARFPPAPPPKGAAPPPEAPPTAIESLERHIVGRAAVAAALYDFYAGRELLNARFRRYAQTQRAVERACEAIVPREGAPTIVVLGDADFTPTAAAPCHGASPIRRIARGLARRTVVVLADEYLTSRTCCACRARMKESTAAETAEVNGGRARLAPDPASKRTARRRRRRADGESPGRGSPPEDEEGDDDDDEKAPRFETVRPRDDGVEPAIRRRLSRFRRCDRCGVHWHRDANAAINIRVLGRDALLGRPRPPEFCRPAPHCAV